MKFSLSTCWFAGLTLSGEAIADEAAKLGFSALELGYALPEAAVPGIMKRVGEGRIGISSIHAFSPVPEGTNGHPELYSPASPDEAKRVEAVEKILGCLAFARDCGADRVVLHAGRITKAARHWLYVHNRIMNENDEGFFYRRRLRKMNEARAAGIEAALGSLHRSLCELLPHFEEAGVKLALENLPSFDAIPSPDEMDLLAAEFSQSPSFAFWFDMGHAQVMENAGYGDAADLARRHLKLIAGVHVHDVIGPGGDHQAPGMGGIDWRRFSFLAGSGKALVFEPLSSVPSDELSAALSFLENTWPGTPGKEA